MRRMVLRALIALFAGLVGGASVVVTAYAFPDPLFPHAVERGSLSVRSNTPLEADAALALLERVDAQLSASPLGPPRDEITFFVSDGALREWVYFLTVPDAGGVVYAPIAPDNVFLTGADFDEDLLVKRGRTITPPRTLTYFATHEAAHAMTVDRIGVWRYQQLPRWVREGLADYVALGAPGADETRAIDVARRRMGRADLELMINYGSYPFERVRVTAALAKPGCTVDALLSMTSAQETGPCL